MVFQSQTAVAKNGIVNKGSSVNDVVPMFIWWPKIVWGGRVISYSKTFHISKLADIDSTLPY